MTAPSPKAPPSLGRYRLLATLGTGSTSHVYLARATGYSEVGKFFAVKVLRANLAQKPGETESFLAEHRLGAMVKHKRVIGVFEVGSDRGRAYAALQYVRGEPLERVLNAVDAEDRKLSLKLGPIYLPPSPTGFTPPIMSARSRTALYSRKISSSVSTVFRGSPIAESPRWRRIFSTIFLRSEN